MGMRQHAAQHRFSVQVLAGVVGNLLVRFYLLPSPPTSVDYLIFLQEMLPSLFDPVPQLVRHHMWFRQVGPPPDYGRCVRELLNQVFGHRWIGRSGTFPCADILQNPDVLEFGDTIVRRFGDTVVRRFGDTVVRRFGDTVVRRFGDTVVRRFGDTIVRRFFQ
ncbi:uncharacterized protein TNCT_433861 [Trichonephila clavata]|uniref:Uncharacterized protein n=1 Tax=Trichonephila clavata TaxID=2740835 RepID=A0A8X6LRK4_TRICU|nr:uncharacterized protein TNCT_433861 [Trichonephila clavata]